MTRGHSVSMSWFPVHEMGTRTLLQLVKCYFADHGQRHSWLDQYISQVVDGHTERSTLAAHCTSSPAVLSLLSLMWDDSSLKAPLGKCQVLGFTCFLTLESE